MTGCTRQNLSFARGCKLSQNSLHKIPAKSNGVTVEILYRQQNTAMKLIQIYYTPYCNSANSFLRNSNSICKLFCSVFSFGLSFRIKSSYLSKYSSIAVKLFQRLDLCFYNGYRKDQRGYMSLYTFCRSLCPSIVR